MTVIFCLSKARTQRYYTLRSNLSRSNMSSNAVAIHPMGLSEEVGVGIRDEGMPS